MRIAIVTINFNGSEDTIKLLKSLEDQTNKDFEIIVVDNASEEADFLNLQNAVIELNTTNFQVIRNKENLGFSGGNNIGIRQALQNGASWVVLLNNDTWVERDFIDRLRGVLESKNAIVGIPLTEGDRTVYCGKLEWLKPTLKHAYQLTSLPAYQLYAIGGAMAVHKDVFEKIGFLDEKYFLYFEDADFSIQAKMAEFKIAVANSPTDELSVHHHISSSTKKLGSPLLLRYHYRNALYFNLKNGPWYIKLLVWPWSWIILVKQSVKLILKRNINQSKSILAGVIDFYKNKYGKI